MELAVPGTYIAGEPLVTIAAFAPQLQVISSKQRPRKLTIHGGDGAEYMFLLKGHEVRAQTPCRSGLGGWERRWLGVAGWEWFGVAGALLAAFLRKRARGVRAAASMRQWQRR